MSRIAADDVVWIERVKAVGRISPGLDAGNPKVVEDPAIGNKHALALILAVLLEFIDPVEGGQHHRVGRRTGYGVSDSHLIADDLTGTPTARLGVAEAECRSCPQFARIDDGTQLAPLHLPDKHLAE